MIDGEGGAGAAEVIEGGDGGESGGGAPPAAPEWLAGMPDELKSNPTLSRYADVEQLARGMVETKALVGSKLILPGDGATDEDWGKFYNAIGRPEAPDKYELPMIELPVDATDDMRAARDEALKPYRDFAHQQGLTQKQASAIVQFDLDRHAAAQAQGQSEVEALKDQLKADYAPKLAAAQQVAKQIFGDDDEMLKIINEMDGKLGSGRFLKGMMRLAEVAGEAKLIDSDKVDGFGEVGDASAKIDALMADKSWREKYTAKDPTTVQQYERLLDLAKRQAMRGRGQASAG